jgi:hypothetical protein
VVAAPAPHLSLAQAGRESLALRRSVVVLTLLVNQLVPHVRQLALP